MQFIDELKRRRVVRALSLYLAAAWVVAQVVGEVLAPAFGWGDGAIRWVVVAAALGLPIVAVLSWAFDLGGPAPGIEKPPEGWFSLKAGSAVIALLGAGAVLGWLARPGPRPPELAGPSMAVLPFQSLTGDEDRYLSDGLTEDLVVALQKAGAFEIIGRNSTERFRRGESSPAQVAQELGVRYVLTGSVRRAGEQLRVAVQLTDGATSRSVWADQYDQALTVDNVFDMYSRVAQNVTRSVQIELTSDARELLRQRPTESLAAYQLYMRGRSDWSRRLPELMDRAIEYFDRAIEVDPDFAKAHAGRADAWILQAFYRLGESRAALAEAKAGARRALELDPGLAEAHTSLAYAKWLGDWDWQGAESSFRRALELDPDYPTAHHWFGDLLAQQLRTTEALEHLDRALVLDPYAPAFHFDRAKALIWAERYEEALVNFNKAIDIEPAYREVTYGLHSDALISSGREAEGIELLANGTEATESLEAATAIRDAYATGGATAVDGVVLRLLAEAPPDRVDPYFFATTYLALDRPADAIRALEKAVEARSLFSITLYADPHLRRVLWGDARYMELIREIGLNPDELTARP